MKENNNVRMVSRVGGVMGELGRKSGRRDYEKCFERPIRVDIYSIGPQFIELGLRRFANDAKDPRFTRLYPI
ncbi:MAG: hypothetical protein ABII71_04785 [Candidatus Micrarchaeota archaeon]